MQVDAGEDPLPLQRIDARVTLTDPHKPRQAISSSSCLHFIGHSGTESELRLEDQCFRSDFRWIAHTLRGIDANTVRWTYRPILEIVLS